MAWYDDFKESKKKEKEDKELKRRDYAIEKLNELGKKVTINDQQKMLIFQHKGKKVIYYPFTGWFTSKAFKDGRGLKNLLKRLEIKS